MCAGIGYGMMYWTMFVSPWDGRYRWKLFLMLNEIAIAFRQYAALQTRKNDNESVPLYTLHWQYNSYNSA